MTPVGIPTPSRRQAIWAIADQSVVSLGNFVVTVVLARLLAPGDYGIFALLFGAMLFFSTIHASLVSFPLALRGASSARHELDGLISVGLAVTAALLVLEIGLLSLTAALLGRPELMAFVSIAAAATRLQETLRRGLIAHFRHGQAMIGDAVSYLGQAAVVVFVAQSITLSVASTFGIMAATSIAGGVIQLFQARPRRVAIRRLREDTRMFWQIGSWMLWTNVGGMFSIQAFPWTLAALHGPAATAAFQATANLLGMTHPVMFSINNVIVPAVANQRQQGIPAVSKLTKRFALQGAAVLLPYYALLLIWPVAALSLFYGAGSVYTGLSGPVRLFAVAYALLYGSSVLHGFLNGLGQHRSVLRSEMAAVLAAVAIGLPLCFLGVVGASVGFLIVNAARTTAGAVFVRFHRDQLAASQLKAAHA